MKREDAIKTLKELWRETNDPWYEEVYNMAINALEADRKTEPTISKMEQVETMSCAECKHRPIGAEICEEPCHYEPQTDWHYDEQDATWYPYKHEDEPQTMLNDGTLVINVEDATKVGRVLIGDDKNRGGLYYPDDEDEPQTCSVSGRPYSECADCEHFRCTADEPQTERNEK